MVVLGGAAFLMSEVPEYLTTQLDHARFAASLKRASLENYLYLAIAAEPEPLDPKHWTLG